MALVPEILRIFSFNIAVLISGVNSNSLHLAQLCQGHQCLTPEAPMLDYDHTEEQCICRAHPCWNDDGKRHSCNTVDHPFLQMVYDEREALQCRCGSFPTVDSVYINKFKCAGHKCEKPDHPILDVGDNGECLCRSHPCWNDAGQRHSCELPKFPILAYRQDEAGKTVCECKTKFHHPESFSQDMSESVNGEPSDELYEEADFEEEEPEEDEF